MSNRSALLALLGAALLAACSNNTAPPPDPAAAAKAQNEARAAKQLELYDKMRSGGDIEIAATLGAEIVQKYPDTAAAATVRKTLDPLQAQAKQKAETKRLARLWVYTAVPEAGGTQFAGVVDSQHPIKAPDGTARIQLVLRQHPKWGQSVYLLLKNATFDCKKGCPSLPVSFDEAKPERMKATVPSGGEPALFIDDDKVFIAKMSKAHTVTIDVNINGGGEQTVVFEVAGYDASKLPNKPK